MLGFIAPYPRAYARLVLDPGYAPDQAQLIDDYLMHNATRNRGLDLLPLFAHIDPARVRRGIDDKRIKARPTFHFRMPDSRVDEASFRISEQWSTWLEVERLACDRARLAEQSRSVLARLRSPWGWLRGRLLVPSKVSGVPS
jgi:hypothetical protein